MHGRPCRIIGDAEDVTTGRQTVVQTGIPPTSHVSATSRQLLKKRRGRAADRRLRQNAAAEAGQADNQDFIYFTLSPVALIAASIRELRSVRFHSPVLPLSS